MNCNDVIIALIGVGGTLLGTMIGWILSALTYKIGKVSIHADFSTVVHLPAISSDGTPTSNRSRKQTEYLFHCVASNSKQIPVLLKNAHFELKHSYFAKPIIRQALMPEDTSECLGSFKITAPIQFRPQRIEPRTLTEFTIKVNYNNADIQFSKIDLVAYNEKNKKQRFHIYNGLRLRRERKVES